MYLFYNKETLIINGYGINPINSDTYSEYNPEIHNTFEGNFVIPENNEQISINFELDEDENVIECNVNDLDSIIVFLNNEIYFDNDIDFNNNIIILNTKINKYDLLTINALKKKKYKLINNEIKE